MTQMDHLKNIFTKLLETEISVLEFQKSISKTEKDRKGLNKMIRDGKKAIRIVRDLKHTEILVSLYNSFLNKKETYFIMISKTINSKETLKWDKSELGFKEFLDLEAQAHAESQKEFEEKQKQLQSIAQAKKDGKKIQMVFENGKLTPVIVEEPKA